MELGQLKSDSLNIKAERDQYKRERDELSDMLDKECNNNYKLEGQLYDMTKERVSLREDITLLKENQKTREEVIENLREELRTHIQCNDELGRVNKMKEQAIKELKSENKALRLQADEYFELWQDAIKK